MVGDVENWRLGSGFLGKWSSRCAWIQKYFRLHLNFLGLRVPSPIHSWERSSRLGHLVCSGGNSKDATAALSYTSFRYSNLNHHFHIFPFIIPLLSVKPSQACKMLLPAWRGMTFQGKAPSKKSRSRKSNMYVLRHSVIWQSDRSKAPEGESSNYRVVAPLEVLTW